MQAKLRNVSLFFVAWLLWLSPTFAMTGKPPEHQAKRPGTRFVGVASWYGIHHQGRKMANGQKFDRKKLTAACWFYPLGTELRVINLKNGKAVQVTVTDRGPGIRLRRVLDLSEAAAKELDYIDQGLTPVFLSPVAIAVPEASEMTDPLIEPAPVAAAIDTGTAELFAQMDLP
jgi:rare lipoprotein A